MNTIINVLSTTVVQAGEDHSLLFAGMQNQMYGSCSSIVGGCCNCVGSRRGVIIGGCTNTLCGNSASSVFADHNVISSSKNSCIRCCATDSAIHASAYGVVGCNSGAAIAAAFLIGTQNSTSLYSCSGVMGADACTVSAAGTTAFYTIDKASGTFSIYHPDPQKTHTHKLVHSFVEAPTAGDTLYRFEVLVSGGVGTVALPDYFRHLNTDVQLKLTGKDNFGSAMGALDERCEVVNVTADTDGTYNLLIMGTRKDKGAINTFRGPEQLVPKASR